MLVLLMLLVLYWMLLLLLCVGGLEVAVAPDTPCWLLLRLEPAAKCSCLPAPEQQQRRTWSVQRQRH